MKKFTRNEIYEQIDKVQDMTFDLRDAIVKYFVDKHEDGWLPFKNGVGPTLVDAKSGESYSPTAVRADDVNEPMLEFYAYDESETLMIICENDVDFDLSELFCSIVAAEDDGDGNDDNGKLEINITCSVNSEAKPNIKFKASFGGRTFECMPETIGELESKMKELFVNNRI